MLEFLNILFHLIHIISIAVNTTFWIFRRTLKIAQVTQLMTLISWFGFGMVYGLGYCFLTDWHWQIKERMGEKNLPASYIKYVLDHVTGRSWDPNLVDKVTMLVLIVSVAGCLFQTFRLKKASFRA